MENCRIWCSPWDPSPSPANRGTAGSGVQAAHCGAAVTIRSRPPRASCLCHGHSNLKRSHGADLCERLCSVHLQPSRGVLPSAPGWGLSSCAHRQLQEAPGTVSLWQRCPECAAGGRWSARFPSLLPLAVPHCCPCLREALEALVQTVNPGEDRFQGSWQGLQDPSPLGDSYSSCSGATASCFLLGLLDAMRCCGGGSRSAREPCGAAWGMSCTRSDSTPCEQLWWRQRSQKATWASSDTSDRAGGRHRG